MTKLKLKFCLIACIIPHLFWFFLFIGKWLYPRPINILIVMDPTICRRWNYSQIRNGNFQNTPCNSMMQRASYTSAIFSSPEHCALQFRIHYMCYLITWRTLSTQIEASDNRTDAFRKLRMCDYSTGKTDTCLHHLQLLSIELNSHQCFQDKTD